MRVNIHEESFEAVELFGKPALFTNNRIDRAEIPEGFYAYDLRHGDSGEPLTVESEVTVNHAGTVITVEPLAMPSGNDSYIPLGDDGFNFTGEELTFDELITGQGGPEMRMLSMADNFFEKELRKLFENNPVMDDIRFAGRACIGRLTDTTNVKLRFVAMGTHEHYEAIEATVLNRLEGKIDSNTFRFKDILGAKPVNNPNFPNGVMPHIWNGALKGGYEWYGYKPTLADYEQISEAVDGYLEIFQEQTMIQGQRMT